MLDLNWFELISWHADTGQLYVCICTDLKSAAATSATKYIEQLYVMPAWAKDTMQSIISLMAGFAIVWCTYLWLIDVFVLVLIKCTLHVLQGVVGHIPYITVHGDVNSVTNASLRVKGPRHVIIQPRLRKLKNPKLVPSFNMLLYAWFDCSCILPFAKPVVTYNWYLWAQSSRVGGMLTSR